MDAVSSLKVNRVEYFAVYPDGRKVSVDPETIAKHGDAWVNEPDERYRVKIETYVTIAALPLYGTVTYV